MKNKILEFKSGTSNNELELAIRGELLITSEGKKYQLHLNETELKHLSGQSKLGMPCKQVRNGKNKRGLTIFGVK